METEPEKHFWLPVQNKWFNKTRQIKAEPRWLRGAFVFTEVCRAAARHSLPVHISAIAWLTRG